MDQEPPRYGQRADEHDDAQRPVCPRHPDTVAYVSCTRCHRPVCPRCQVQAPVGVQCVDCAREARREAERRGGVVRGRSSIFPRAGATPVTLTLIAINLAVFLLQYLVPNQLVIRELAYMPGLTATEPWRMLTSGFVHSGIAHILLNMYSLYLFGQALEPRMGRWRFLAVFLLSIVGGSAAVYLLTPPYTLVVGASGGVFGLFGAFFAWTRFRGGDTRALLILIAVNLVFGFVVPGISWQAHVGGLVVGAVVAWLFELTSRGRRGRRGGRRRGAART
ncbi:rhomboid family intramembrane serine protease [Rothia sp. AR01]|uniref:Rhomboid family intramembrane serine protease n=1 Tax=Rothia santali TaxID=2949643 RepID=A0A9X2HEU0_9MICC|nr:rhomboid family intramembrane serine protease [Rothia santali]MCP3425492.1 rhomboid family intramembrane serine protease [Rothia santali]